MPDSKCGRELLGYPKYAINPSLSCQATFGDMVASHSHELECKPLDPVRSDFLSVYAGEPHQPLTTNHRPKPELDIYILV